MKRINVLPENVANQIAAGEVVGRPASVVKELMENAVDAGSTYITVNYKDGGKELIQVIDNGCGMSPEDAHLAFERHATSKIRGVDDLYRLTSFGFRGEALPSIAAVSEVELRTRDCDSELGVKININGGQISAEIPENMGVGTQFIVKNLFYNTPARRRFLKDSSTEGRHIVAEFQKVALCNPDISFALYNRDVQEYNLPATNLRQRIIGVISRSNRNISGNLLDVEVDTSLVKIKGYVGRPATAKKNNKEQYLFVNGRYFRSTYFHKAIIQAYSKLIQTDVQPSYFLYLTVDPERIDVNVHPQKTEIKFDDEAALWQIINAAVRESLAKLGVVPMMDFEIDDNMDIPVYKPGVSYKMPDLGINPEFNPFKDSDALESDGMTLSTAKGGNRSSGSNSFKITSFKDTETDMPFDRPTVRFDEYDEIDSSVLNFIEGRDEEDLDIQGSLGIDEGPVFVGVMPMEGRIATTFRGNLTVIDQRRAYERVLFERYIKMAGNNSSVTQQLLFPEVLDFSDEDFSIFRQIENDLDSLGFDFTLCGGNKVEFAGLPSDIGISQLEITLQSIFDNVKDNIINNENRMESMAAVMAVRGASGYGNKLISDVEARSLLDELSECGSYNYTPSGKPIMVVFTDEEVDKRLLYK